MPRTGENPRVVAQWSISQVVPVTPVLTQKQLQDANLTLTEHRWPQPMGTQHALLRRGLDPPVTHAAWDSSPKACAAL